MAFVSTYQGSILVRLVPLTRVPLTRFFEPKVFWPIGPVHPTGSVGQVPGGGPQAHAGGGVAATSRPLGLCGLAGVSWFSGEKEGLGFEVTFCDTKEATLNC